MKRLATASSAGSTEGTSSTRGRFRRTLAALAASAGLALFIAPAAPAADWGFEQVTPVNKGGGTVSYVDTFRTSPDGESFLYTANLPFDSVPAEGAPQYVRYIGHRGPDQWHNISLDPPYEAGQGSGVALNIMSTIASSSNLRYVLVASAFALTPGATEGGGNLYLRDTRTRDLTLVATSPNRQLSSQMQSTQGGISVKYVDGEGKAVLFVTTIPLVDDLPPDVLGNGAGYKWTPEGGLEIVNVLPDSEGGEIVKGGIAGYNVEDATRNGIPVAGGAEHVYWTKFSQSGAEGSYVRTGDETKPVSHSRLPGASPEALPSLVDAISRNGEYAVFHTGEGTPALTADTPEFAWGEWPPTSFIYRYKFSDGSLDYVGTSHLYGTAGVIQMAQDGQTIVFQSEIAQAEGAVNEKPNTYIWRDGELELVATLEKGSFATSTGGSRSLLSENGRFFTFTDRSKALAEKFDQDNVSSACPLSPTEPGPCDAVYVYDSESTGDPLQCASCRAPGVPPADHAGDPLNKNSGMMRMDNRLTQSVANDGTVFFTTLDPLLAADQNKLEDAYAYKDGDLRLVSRGVGNSSARFLDATDDGKTVFISTDDPIYPGDNDRAVDIYMTREGAGYPYTPPPTPPVCAGLESCRGGVPSTPTQSSAGSSSFEGRGNENPRGRRAGSRKLTVLNPRPAAGSSGALKIKAPGKGKLTITGAGVKKATRSVAKAGTYTLKVSLTPAARKALAKSGQAKKRLKVTFKPSQGKAQSTTVKLTFKAPAGQKGGR